MRAQQITGRAPSVRAEDSVWAAARAIAESDAAGVVVLDDDGRPAGVLPACDVVAATLPGYVREDPRLAGVCDEEFAEQVLRRMLTRPLRELLTERQRCVVPADATVVELAAAMARTRSPLLVCARQDSEWSVVSAARLLSQLCLP